MKVAVSVTASWMLMTLCTHVHADNTGNPAGMSPDTPGIENARPAPDYANTQDKLFVRQAALGGRAEVELGKLAQSRAESASVKALGEKMAADHGKANDRLARLGKNINAQVPASLDPDDAAFRSELQRELAARPAADGTPRLIDRDLDAEPAESLDEHAHGCKRAMVHHGAGPVEHDRLQLLHLPAHLRFHPSRRPMLGILSGSGAPPGERDRQG